MYSKDAIQRRAQQIAQKHAQTLVTTPTRAALKRNVEDEPLFKEWNKLAESYRFQQPGYLTDSENTYNFYAGHMGDSEFTKIKMPFIDKLEAQLKDTKSDIATARSNIKSMLKKLEAANDPDPDYPGTNVYDTPIREANTMLDEIKYHDDCVDAALAAIPTMKAAIVEAIKVAIQPMASKLAPITGMD